MSPGAYTIPMEHISAWHDVNPSDRSTFPMIGCSVQVRFEDGTVKGGESGVFFLSAARFRTL